MDDKLLLFIVAVPGVLALLLFAVFAYLYSQSPEGYFRAWKYGWAAFCLSYGFSAWFLYSQPGTLGASAPVLWISKIFYAAVVLAVLYSSYLIKPGFELKPYHIVLPLGLFLWISATVSESARLRDSITWHSIPLDPEMGFVLLLLFAAFRFYWISRERGSLGFRILALSVAAWAALIIVRLTTPMALNTYFGGAAHFLGPLPLTMLGIAMLTVLYENERSSVQENLLAFSDLEVGFSRVLSMSELSPGMDKLLERLCSLARTEHAILYVLERYRSVLPNAQRGMAEGFLDRLEKEVGNAVGLLLNITGTGAPPIAQDETKRSPFLLLQVPLKVLRSQADPRLVRLAEMLSSTNAVELTVLVLETRERHLGLVLLPYAERSALSRTQKNMLTSLAIQLGTTLEKYALLQDAQRRSQEFELMTEIGQVVSSRLDQDEVLTAIHRELSRLIDTSSFYVAFQNGETIEFAFEIDDGERRTPRTRPTTNGLTEHIIRSGKPLLVESDLEKVRENLGVVKVSHPAKSFCGVPIFRNGKSVGMMAALNYQKENTYGPRDLEMLGIAARQVSIAMENARLFTREQQRAKYLAFLNNVSKTAISSQNSEEMLEEIAREIQQTFPYDHIGIGIVDYNSKEIEIKAEAGTTEKALGKRIPLGVGIMGRVARSNEVLLMQGTNEHLLGIVPDSRSVLCLPITYSDTQLGILNVESRTDNAFHDEEVLILRTLADLLATALHNVFVFQKMEQQSITDPLTGIKTRRFFNEAMLSEYKRALRSGRPFSVVVIDLDKFKEVNDGMGHLEGDLVLARIGRILDQKVRQSNVVARYGGDEFVILMPETGVEQANILSERLRLWIATDPFLNDRHVTGSFGVATFPLHGATVEDIFRSADEGMYQSKRAGGNKVSTMDINAENASQSELVQIIGGHLDSLLRRDNTPTVDEIVDALQLIGAAVGPDGRSIALMEAMKSITRSVEMRELHAAGHGEAVSSYALAIAGEMGLSPEECEDLGFAAFVHDIGKITVSEAILNKAGALTFDEYQAVKSHAAAGANIAKVLAGSERMQQHILHHQERYDGGGYPDGLRGEEIPLGARIIAVAEAYVNMTNDRPYATMMKTGDAMLELERMSGTQFDGMLVRILLKQLKGEKSAR